MSDSVSASIQIGRHLGVFDLPSSLAREVGRIVVRWSYFENYIQSLAYLLLEVDFGIGRSAIREPRISERLEMISELAYLLDIPVDQDSLDSMKERSETTQKLRDLLVHGGWTYSAVHQSYAVRLTRGTWPKIPFDKTTRHGRKKRLKPEFQLVNRQSLLDIRIDIDALISDIQQFQLNLSDALRTLRDRSSEQFVC